MSLPALSLHSENIALRTKVQLLETRLAQSEAKRKAHVGASFLLLCLIQYHCGGVSAVYRKALAIVHRANGLPPKGTQIH